MHSSMRLGLSAFLVATALAINVAPGGSAAGATSQNPPAAAPAQAPAPGGSAQGGPGRGGRGNPAAGLVAQFCASCHGPTLQGGSAASLMDEDWKFGGEDASHHGEHSRGTSPARQWWPFKESSPTSKSARSSSTSANRRANSRASPKPRSTRTARSSRSEKQTVKLEVIAKDLETPWGMAFLPDGRLLITERPGRLRILEKGQLLPPVTGHADGMGAAGRRPVRRRGPSRPT